MIPIAAIVRKELFTDLEHNMTIALTIIAIILWFLMSLITWWIIIIINPGFRVGVFGDNTKDMVWKDFLFAQIWPCVLLGLFIIVITIILKNIFKLKSLNLFKIYNKIADNAIATRGILDGP